MDDYFDRKSVRVVVIGVVAMAAIAVGAATVTSALDTGAAPVDPGDDREPGELDPQPDPSEPSDPDQGPPDEGTPVGTPGPPGDPGDLSRCVQPLTTWWGGLAYFGVFAAAVGLIKRRYTFGASLLGVYALAPPVLLSYFLSTDCPTVGGRGTGPGNVTGDIFPGTGGDPLVTNLPAEAVLGVFGVVLVGTAAALYRASGGDTISNIEERDPEADDADPFTPRDLAAAAGRAADRLEEHNADVDNEVYRAWWEMTSMLDVADPDTATPGEFADAAVAAGMGEDDVAELTRLFEEVRYGQRDPASREKVALSVFRSIEHAYGERTDESDEGGR
ncbi:hypothetical protein C475_16184 [Halosimplex carlsbadense 2-9-1]|uniref:Protein-glutamine gamma-glutamyltransferase-like C-terminal domain-containing protein n=1 Tax=Halosimplex carlsbadense 2-9-1 TaxID=797114 RepID=M0CMU7_9EURY|nr:DUF4129 domain-containing protein [Halosimplex carlsbadense]ELZ23204.1 hypothetical protein C475_16184 [Halosimplex carlsbadense 2-9-1]